MTALYSERLLALWNASGPVSMVVPAGKRAIVMTVAVLNLGSVDIAANVSVTGSAALAWVTCPGPNKGVQVTQLRQVAYAGETLTLSMAGGAGYATVSGYLLSGL